MDVGHEVHDVRDAGDARVAHGRVLRGPRVPNQQGKGLSMLRVLQSVIKRVVLEVDLLH